MPKYAIDSFQIQAAARSAARELAYRDEALTHGEIELTIVNAILVALGVPEDEILK